TPGSTDPLDHPKHLILPAIVLSLEALAGVTRYTRASMMDVLGQDFVTTARAKGLPERLVTLRHAFRNALLPVITVVSLRIPLLLGGAVVIESVFQWPGMGTLAISSIEQRDYPVLMGLTLMTAPLVLFSNLIADMLYAYADPRIRYSQRGGRSHGSPAGRDVLARLLYAARVSMSVGLVAVAIATCIGTLVGLTAGYAGGGVDNLLMRLTEFVQTFPLFFAVVILVALVGPNVFNVMAV